MWLAKFCGEVSLIGWLIKCGKETVQVLAGKKTAKILLMENVAKGLRDCGEPSFTR
jgi:hypothetical protein